MDNKRYFKRINFHIEAAAKINNIIYAGELYDIALKGALIKMKKKPDKYSGKKCSVILNLPNSNIKLEFEAKIVHQNNNYIGFKFNGADVDSITHLRRLLVLNTGDEEGIDRELLSWLNN
jgi:PilZ domain